jgi:mannosyltransferase OCH1-like enzyme
MTYTCYCGKIFRKLASITAHKTQCNALSPAEQSEYLNRYVKSSFEGIEYINNVPKVVFVFWFGTKDNELPYMSVNRFNAFQSLVTNIDVPVIIITQSNLSSFLKPEYPLHKSYEYLSGVHKSDYLRCYFLEHYGGGYHDIKHRNDSWVQCWNDDLWLQDDNIWMYGRREKLEGAIGYPPGMKHIQKEYNKLVSMGWIICKPNTPFLQELNNSINEILTLNYDMLQKYPAKNPGGYYSDKPFDLVPNNSYPLRWLEILGEIYHPLMLKYTMHIKFGLPDALKTKRYK